MYQNILVPVNGSDTAERALREAIQLAHNLSQICIPTWVEARLRCMRLALAS